MKQPTTLTGQEEDFLEQYLKTAFWVAGMEPQELEENSYREAVIDCLTFLSRINCPPLNYTNTHQAAHNFYLSRNGQGPGFWDRPKAYSYTVGNYVDKFQAIAEGFGPTNYYTIEGELVA